jgi:hypothetical protein
LFLLGVDLIALISLTSSSVETFAQNSLMPGTTSRKAFADFIDAAQGDICVIPSEIFAGLVKDQQQRDEKLWGVLNRIADVLETEKEAKRSHFQALEMKLDAIILAQNDTRKQTCMDMIGEKISNLTETINRSSTTTVGNASGNDNNSINKYILKLKDLRGQYLRSEKTSELMEELLTKDKPYVQRKFRVKVNKDTHADEISYHKENAERMARTEIALMKCRMKRWENEMNVLKTNISNALSNPSMQNESKKKYEQRMKRDEETNVKERDIAVKKIKDTYESEINSGATQFLLKYVDGVNESGERDDRDPSGRFRRRPARNQRNHRPSY